MVLYMEVTKFWEAYVILGMIDVDIEIRHRQGDAQDIYFSLLLLPLGSQSNQTPPFPL